MTPADASGHLLPCALLQSPSCMKGGVVVCGHQDAALGRRQVCRREHMAREGVSWILAPINYCTMPRREYPWGQDT